MRKWCFYGNRNLWKDVDKSLIYLDVDKTVKYSFRFLLTSK